MITPNRYHLWAALECHAFSKAEAVLKFSAEEDGMWVQWQDYARLKAEVERLRASSFVTAVPVEEYEKLKAEVERLRKAGDEMANRLTNPDRGKSYFYPVLHDALCAWTAAKDGKQP